MIYPTALKASKHIRLLPLRLVGVWLDLRYPLVFLWCKSQSAVKSLIGHWKSHTGRVDIGPEFRLAPDRSLEREPRTIARSKGIDTELAKYPWTDLIDHQIFLDGFDAGERSSQCNLDSD